MGSLGAIRGTQEGELGAPIPRRFPSLECSLKVKAGGLLCSGVCIGLSRVPYSMASCRLEGGTFSMVWTVKQLTSLHALGERVLAGRNEKRRLIRQVR